MRHVWPLFLAVGCAVAKEVPPLPAAKSEAPVAAPTEKQLPPPELAGFGKCKINHCTFHFAQAATGDATTALRDRCDESVADCKPLQGSLTSQALSKVHDLAARLEQTKLEEVYGCPACADGLAYHVVLHHKDGRVTKHSADPEYTEELPPVLAEVMAFSKAIDDAVSECRASDLVTPSTNCQTMKTKTENVRMMVP
jgi:hypothetical protein